MAEETPHSKKNTCYPLSNLVEVPSCCEPVWWIQAFVKAESGMNSTQFFRIMFKQQSQSWSWGWIFQQDNDPKHSSNCRKVFRSRMFLNGGHSPLTWISLKIYGMIWSRLSMLGNLTERFSIEKWSNIPPSRIQTLIKGYRRHLEAVWFAKGGSTK